MIQSKKRKNETSKPNIYVFFARKLINTDNGKPSKYE